eukprot:4359505-Alexandrium_andersonii.AAC.1
MAAGPARLHVQQPRQNVSRPVRHRTAPVCRLGVVDVLSENGLARVRVTRLAAEHLCPRRPILGRRAHVLGLVIEPDVDLVLAPFVCGEHGLGASGVAAG